MLSTLIRRITSLNIYNVSRTLTTTSQLQLKQVQEIKDGKSLVISAEIVPSEREPYLYKPADNCRACPICASGLNIKHTDVLIISQFVRSDGCMLPRRITGLCRAQQKRMASLVAMAQKAGLMPNLNPAWSKKDPKQRYAWKKFNKYFDESTIKIYVPRKFQSNKLKY